MRKPKLKLAYVDTLVTGKVLDYIISQVSPMIYDEALEKFWGDDNDLANLLNSDIREQLREQLDEQA